MKRVLVIAYYYPPLADVGCNRTLRFVTHMQENGWEPHLLTVKNPDSHFCLLKNGQKPPSHIPTTRALSVINTFKLLGKLNGLAHRLKDRIPFLNTFYPVHEWLAIPDFTPGWLPSAYINAKRLLSQNRFDLIYASIPPLGGGLLAMKLSKKAHIPLVIDVRDPISKRIIGITSKTTARENFCQKKELELLTSSSLFIVTTQTIQQKYREISPQDSHKIKLIYNGFDVIKEDPSVPLEQDKFKIIYIGNFYLGILDPSPFFIALRQFMDENNIPPDRVVFWMLCENNDILKSLIKQYDLNEVVKIIGRKKRSEMLHYIRSANLFFLRNYFTTSIGAKFFDGLAFEMDILSTFSHTEVQNLIEKYAKRHTILENENIVHIKEALLKHYRISHPTVNAYNESFIKDFNGSKLTADLCLLFNEVLRDIKPL